MGKNDTRTPEEEYELLDDDESTPTSSPAQSGPEQKLYGELKIRVSKLKGLKIALKNQKNQVKELLYLKALLKINSEDG